MEHKIVPHLWFDKEAEEAAEFYVSVFSAAAKRFGEQAKSEITSITTLHNTPSSPSDGRDGDTDIVSYKLSGQPFMAISAGPVFRFNESISFIVSCETQEEIDYYWEKLSAVPEAEQCGWLKDKYGLSWQIVPSEMDRMMQKGNPEQIANLTQAFLEMKKFDVAKLKEAYNSDKK